VIGSKDIAFKQELKKLIIKECDLSVNPESVNDTAPMFGPESPWGLDSIDALQISVAIQNKYGIAITDSKDMRRITESFNNLSDFIRPQ
jgi:acyl carrier protein